MSGGPDGPKLIDGPNFAPATASGAAASLPAPDTEAALVQRATALAGLTVGELARSLLVPLPAEPKRAKGFVGTLLEKALGATAGARDVPDFPELGIELKTIPIDTRGRPRESTFVCTVPLLEICETPWERSRAQRKLACVLWMPIETRPGLELGGRRIGSPLLWRPNHEEQQALRTDWEELAGLIGAGHADSLQGHLGQCLQVRPKAAHGRVRRRVLGTEGWVDTLPRGFYLRASFTERVLRRLRRELLTEPPFPE